MPKSKYAPDTRIRAAFAFYLNGNANEVASQYGIDQPKRLYEWRAKALAACRPAFCQKPGPKPKVCVPISAEGGSSGPPVGAPAAEANDRASSGGAADAPVSDGVRWDGTFLGFLLVALRACCGGLFARWEAYGGKDLRVEKLSFPLMMGPMRCPHCGSSRIRKNGRYEVREHILSLIFGISWEPYGQLRLQRWECSECEAPLHSFAQVANKYGREESRVRRLRLLALGRFGLGLSIRGIVLLIDHVFGVRVSVGWVQRHAVRLGQRSGHFLAQLTGLAQKGCRWLMMDETFLKIGRGAKACLAVVIGEHGLIRQIRVVGKCTVGALSEVCARAIGGACRPVKLLTDFAPAYSKVARGSGLRHFLDTVHAMRVVYRKFEGAIRESLRTSPRTKGRTRKEVKAQLDHKKRSLKKVLYPIRNLLIGVLKSSWLPPKEGGRTRREVIAECLDELRGLPVGQTKELAKELKKFFDKYLGQLETALRRQDMPSTTNEIESVMSLLKPFIKMMKAMSSIRNINALFSGRALWLNFRRLTRGRRAGTTAIERAGIDTPAQDFLEALGLESDYEVRLRREVRRVS